MKTNTYDNGIYSLPQTNVRYLIHLTIMTLMKMANNY